MQGVQKKRFPHESESYRKARDLLLIKELQLRQQTEEVAALRRKLPLGGMVKTDYVFTEKENRQVKFSKLFEKDKDTLVIYSMMLDKGWKEPCPMCNSIVDGLNGNARQISQRVNLVIVAKAPIEQILSFANKSSWSHLRFLSSSDNAYNTDYYGEDDGEQMPMLNVFLKRNDGIYHTWGSEMRFAKNDPGQDERLVDIIWPLWNVLDLTPHGRGTWYPEIRLK